LQVHVSRILFYLERLLSDIEEIQFYFEMILGSGTDPTQKTIFHDIN